MLLIFVGCRGQLNVGILVLIPELGNSVSLARELNFQTGEAVDSSVFLIFAVDDHYHVVVDNS